MELAALIGAGSHLWWAPSGDGGKVIVLPGFSLDDSSTLWLRSYIAWLGYEVHGLGVGANFGRRTFGDGFRRLDTLIDDLRGDQRVSLVGHSLGGVMARDYARRHPEHVARVVCLGSPHVGDERSMPAGVVWWRRTMTDEDVTAQPDPSPLPVPHTIIYSDTDGIVSPFDCRGDHAEADNVRISGSHLGLVANAQAFRVIAERLGADVQERRRLADVETVPERPRNLAGTRALAV